MNVAEIIADGVVDSQEAAEILKEVLGDDGVVDQAEANMLIEINDGVSGNDNSPAWGITFATAIANHVLSDDKTPGVVDEDEAAWVIAAFEGDGQLDATEMAACEVIKVLATKIHPSLQAKFDEWGV